jgi:hypothetical protein
MLAAQNGEISTETFLDYLQDAQVFLPVADKSGIRNFQTSDKAVPLTIETEDGETVLVMFSSPERAKPFLEDYPDYAGGLLAEFKWVVEKMGGACGISLNPGWDLGIDLEPQILQQMGHGQERTH